MADFVLLYIREWIGEAEDAISLRAVLRRYGHRVKLISAPEDNVEGFEFDHEVLKGAIVVNCIRRLYIPRSTGYRLLMWSPEPEDFSHPAALEWDGVVTNSRVIFRDRLGDIPLMLRPLPVDLEVYRPRRPRADLRCDVLHIGSTHKPLSTVNLYLGPATRFQLRLYGIDWSSWEYKYATGLVVHQRLGRVHARLYGSFHHGVLKRELVPAAYSSCAINLSFHVPLHLEADQPSNRLLQAMACACFTIEDRMPWHMEEFWDCAAFTRGGQETERLIEYYLAHPEERMAIARRGRARIAELGYDSASVVKDLEAFASDLRTRGRGRIAS